MVYTKSERYVRPHGHVVRSSRTATWMKLPFMRPAPFKPLSLPSTGCCSECTTSTDSASAHAHVIAIVVRRKDAFFASLAARRSSLSCDATRARIQVALIHSLRKLRECESRLSLRCYRIDGRCAVCNLITSATIGLERKRRGSSENFKWLKCQKLLGKE